ncbi:MAG: NAD(P)H-dependent glycerol-3-phosphate dehydrogenase [Paludibacteraceae bacterium]|nr:NAD(P)H-dependent glycerol-3-phosphate dehydrogenase [Paludibacteraceae bacterium]
MNLLDKKVAILGGGSWATALAKIVQTNVGSINWYMRKQEQIDEFLRTGKNPEYLRSLAFDTSTIHFTTDINEVVGNSDVLILAIPSPFIKMHLKKLRRSIRRKIIISAIKGMVPDENMVVTDYLHIRYEVPNENLGMIAGPCHAEEVATERLSYLTIGCCNRENACAMAQLFEMPFVRTNTSDDVWGLEYSSVMKNIYAIASGICYGLKYGDNFQAVLTSNAIQEINRFANATNPLRRDIDSSAYLGDLLVTAYSQFSRNRQFGNMIGRGYSVRTAQLEMEMIAEGFYGTKCIHDFNERFHVDLPIVEAVYNILYNQASPMLEIKELTKKLK